jgi:hypothetical protein
MANLAVTMQPGRGTMRGARRNLIVLAAIAAWLTLWTGPSAFSAARVSPESNGDVASDRLFQRNEVLTFKLTLDGDAMQRLNATPDAFVSGTFTYDTIVVRNVGVRIKGESSARHLGKKAPFKIHFGKFVPHQEFMGLQSLTLNNMVQDPSMIRESLAYELYRAAGVPAPRTGFANVYVNDQLFGLYLNVETEDRVFLGRAFADPSGNLYKGGSGVDLRMTDVAKFNQEEGKTNDDLKALVAAVAAGGDALFYGAAAPIDTPRFLQMLAVDTIIGHWDGYVGPNNYFIYHEPTIQRWTFLPWGADQTFKTDLFPFGGKSVLARKCLASARCKADYVATFQRVLDTFDGAKLGASLDRWEALILPSIQQDKRKESTNTASAQARTSARAFIQGRSARLRPRLTQSSPRK